MVNQLLAESKRLLFDIAASTLGRSIRVLLYHSISDDRKDPLAVSPALFRRQMACLAEARVHVVSGNECLQMLSGATGLIQSVCLTFDDGFEDFAIAALPVLREHGFPSTLFVSTGLVGTSTVRPTWSQPRRFLDWEKLEHLTSAGVEVGSHAVSHVRLSSLSGSDLQTELRQSRADIRERLSCCLDAIAYPYGDCSTDVLHTAQIAGYRAGFVVGGLWGNRRGMDAFALRRTQVTSATAPEEIAIIAKGHSDMAQVMSDIKPRIRSALPSTEFHR